MLHSKIVAIFAHNDQINGTDITNGRVLFERNVPLIANIRYVTHDQQGKKINKQEVEILLIS